CHVVSSTSVRVRKSATIFGTAHAPSKSVTAPIARPMSRPAQQILLRQSDDDAGSRTNCRKGRVASDGSAARLYYFYIREKQRPGADCTRPDNAGHVAGGSFTGGLGTSSCGGVLPHSAAHPSVGRTPAPAGCGRDC